MTTIKKLEALKTNETFAQEMSTAATAEDVQAIFAKYDIDFTLAEAQQMLDEVKISDADELSADDLENVTGGYIGLIIAVAILILAIYIYTQRTRGR